MPNLRINEPAEGVDFTWAKVSPPKRVPDFLDVLLISLAASSFVSMLMGLFLWWLLR